MSRTYRKTSLKQGSPRRWGKRSMARWDHKKAHKPKPYTIKSAIYGTVVEEVTTDYRWDCPMDLRIYVSKGTPHAREELGEELPDQPERKYVWERPLRYESKWYIVPPNKTTQFTRRRYIGPNPEYDWEAQMAIWDDQRLFDHVRRNRTGGRSPISTKFRKRMEIRRLRREGLEFIRNWEDEYHLNQHLEPYNYLLDEYRGEWEDELWDGHEEWMDYSNTEDFPDEPKYDPYDNYYDIWDDYDYAWDFD